MRDSQFLGWTEAAKSGMLRSEDNGRREGHEPEADGRVYRGAAQGEELDPGGVGRAAGVSNKTVSRWETGSYMPGIEILSLLSREFGVGLNGLVSGQRLADESFREEADRNLTAAVMERKWFPRFRQWLRTHSGSLMVMALLCLVIAGLARYVDLYSGSIRRMPPFRGRSASTP